MKSTDKITALDEDQGPLFDTPVNEEVQAKKETSPSLLMPGVIDFWHPAAEAYPLIPTEELVELARSIKANGQRHPIIAYSGKAHPQYVNCGLDGRNRLAACRVAGVEPLFVFVGDDLTGPSLADYIADLNTMRRHLSPSQLATAAAKLVQVYRSEAPEPRTKPAPAIPSALAQESEDAEPEADEPRYTRNTERAAAKVGVSRASVERAQAVKKASEYLFDLIEKGEIPVATAFKLLPHKESHPLLWAELEKGRWPTDRFAQLCKMFDDRPDLVKDVKVGKKTLSEAFNDWEADKKALSVSQSADHPKPAEKSEPNEKPLGGFSTPNSKDEYGVVVPDQLLKVFADADTIALLANDVLQIKNRVARVAEQAGGEMLVAQTISQNLVGVRDALLEGRPMLVCGTCKGHGHYVFPGGSKTKCKVCNGRGWLSKRQASFLTEDQIRLFQAAAAKQLAEAKPAKGEK